MKPTSFQTNEITVPAPKEIFNYRVYALAIVASMGAVLFGYDLAFIGPSITLGPFVKYAIMTPKEVL